MNILLNLLWFFLGGLLLAAGYALVGLFLCLTIIGIPFGLQIFKLAGLAAWPFGKEVGQIPGSGALDSVMTALWLLLGGFTIAMAHLSIGIAFCFTIIGIPFGLQHFKLMRLALYPFGHTISPSWKGGF